MSRIKFFNMVETCLKGLGLAYLVYSIYAIPWRYVNELMPGAANSAFLFIIFLIIVFISRSPISASLNRINDWLRQLCSILVKRSFWQILMIGLFLRVFWILATDTVLIIDAYSYFTHAKNLVFNGYYGFDGGTSDAFWPPGYPLALSPFMLIFGPYEFVVPLLNLVMFVLTAIGVWKFVNLLYGEQAAKLTIWSLALWPNFIYLVNTGTKEAIIVSLLSWLCYSYFEYVKFKQIRYSITSALLLGLMILVQPSLGVMLVAVILTHLIATQKIAPTIILTFVMILGLVIIVSPWTYRNYLLYDQIVPVSTNGGVLFYSMNNETALAGYNDPPENLEFLALDPVEKSSRGFELGIQWIKENPGAFLDLAYQKGLVYLSNDDTSLWQIYSGDSNNGRSMLYYFLNFVANGYWMIISLIILAGIYFSQRKLDTFEVLATFGFLGFLSVEFLFEAGTRHHIPLYPIMAVMAAKVLSKSQYEQDI